MQRLAGSADTVTVRYKLVHDSYNADSDGYGTPAFQSGFATATYGTVMIAGEEKGGGKGDILEWHQFKPQLLRIPGLCIAPRWDVS